MRSLIHSLAYRASIRLASFAVKSHKNQSIVTLEVDGVSNSIKDNSTAVVITTFSSRFFENCLPLIESLRRAKIESPIYLVVNGDFDSAFDQGARKEFLSHSLRFDVNPICFGTFRGLATMWNVGIRHADSDVTIVLNDDLLVLDKDLDSLFNSLASEAALQGLSVLNNHWSVFAISRECVNKVGWFDERLLGIGEEDGDYARRYSNHFGKEPPILHSRSLHNTVAESADRGVAKGVGKYSKWNRVFIQTKNILIAKSAELGNTNKHTLYEINPYPLEDFRRINYENLKLTENESLKSRILDVENKKFLTPKDLEAY